MFPITNVIVKLPPNGDEFHAHHVEEKYNLYLDIQTHYPMIPRGGFHLHVLKEDEEEETTVFELVLDPSHLQTTVLLEEMGDLLLFAIVFSWWLSPEKDDVPTDSWSVTIALDPNEIHSPNRSYGLCHMEEETIVKWFDQLPDLLLSTDSYADSILKTIAQQLQDCLDELQL